MRKVYVKPQPDTTKCEIHEYEADYIGPRFLVLLARPGGLDACRACIERVAEWARADNERRALELAP